MISKCTKKETEKGKTWLLKDMNYMLHMVQVQKVCFYVTVSFGCNYEFHAERTPTTNAIKFVNKKGTET